MKNNLICQHWSQQVQFNSINQSTSCGRRYRAGDKFIRKLSKKFKNYGWETNCGYGTKKHLLALKKFGATHHHRKTFAPIHKI